MTVRPAHFTRTDENCFLPTGYAQSHWGEDHLNGPAVVGLAAYALQTAFEMPGFLPARLTVDLFKAARGVPTTTEVELIRDGRRVRNAACAIVQGGVTVARATLTQYRQSEAPRGEEWSRTTDFVPPTDVGDTSPINMGSDGVGWTHAIADHQNAGRKRCLNRTVDVVDGTPNTAFIRAVMAAEGTSLVTNLGTAGVGYINGDLTVALARLPLDEWVGVEADAHWASDGVAVGAATLYDRVGAFGTGLVTAISNPAAQIDFADDPFPSRTH